MSTEKSSKDSANVRHSSRIAAMASQKRTASESFSSSPSSPKLRKTENPIPIFTTRRKLLEKKVAKLQKFCHQHEELIAEEFYLNQRGVILDFASWRKNPSQDLLAHLKANALDISDVSVDSKSPPADVAASAAAAPLVAVVVPASPPKEVIAVVPPAAMTPVKTEPVVEPLTINIRGKPKISLPEKKDDSTTQSSSAVFARSSPSVAPSVVVSGLTSVLTAPDDTASSSSTSSCPTPMAPSPLITKALISMKSPIRPAEAYIGSIERAAKQEANVLRRIAELRRQGLWSARKMPRCVDPPRNKTHWDYLLEEMQWMAIDFEQERKWKRSATRKIATAIARQKRELEDRGRKQELEKEKELKRIAAYAAREVRTFWNNVEKVVEYKSDSILEAKKKRALDLHLDFIVGQTEKFSSLIQEGLNKGPSRSISPSLQGNDSDFEAGDSSDDDETTIAKAEKSLKITEVEDEVALLQKESEMDIDDILNLLPAGYIDDYGGPAASSTAPSSSTRDKSDEDDDSNESESESTTNDADDKADSRKSADSFCNQQPSTSVDDIDFKKLQSTNSEERQMELTNIAEAAEKLLPKGFTLESVNIVTKQPFLLKHELREYQRVGLDWLVTLYEKKLNGILADEMGLGKTIQTIALLAYLACERHNWGPHLIVVPTTVLLNWEMEFKKWCPSFKILTYYGALKERKEKRKGWSKPNSFHVCITSYKLVMQDNVVFRRKNWEYLVLDEAQNIKNFKSQRWQMLLHFKTERRLLLTGTPLQNSLMELWSLMHFLMPQIFGSHKDFRDWFSNPLTGMIEGTQDFNEQTIKRLHKVLRPFLLRRLKVDVEKQLPKKYEHLVMCQLSKRQRFLYEDFMSKGSTKDQLISGNVMNVMNILMQLRKVCNHPFLFEPRPILSPFVVNSLTYTISSLICDVLRPDSVKNFTFPNFITLENFDKKCALRAQELLPNKKLIEEIDNPNDPPAVPVVSGFTFASRIKPQKFSPLVRNFSSSDSSTKQLQFVIPTTVAQNMNLSDPFIIQVKMGNTQKNIPVMLKDIPAIGLQKIGLSPQSSSSSSSLNSNSPTVLRLVQQTTAKNSSLQAVQVSVANSSPIASNSFAAIVSAAQSASPSPTVGRPPGITVTVPRFSVNQRGVLPTFFSNVHGNLSGVINARTQRPTSILSGNIGVYSTRSITPISSVTLSSIRPQITVQDVTPKSSPVICVFDPNKVPGSPLEIPKSPVISSTIINTQLARSLASNQTIITPPTVADDKDVKVIYPNDNNRPTSSSSMTPKLNVGSSIVPKPIKHIDSEASPFELPPLKRRKLERRMQCRTRLMNVNRRRCSEYPLYGENLRQLMSVCERKIDSEGLVLPWQERLLIMKPILDRFVIAVQPVKIRSTVRLNAARSTFVTHEEDRLSFEASRRISDVLTPFSNILVYSSIQFPELRLIEYDCGKLQKLAELLRKLKLNGSRCLVFTQMTRMLDILEAFLSYHGYTYLRLDGATRIEQRQILMERFNQDSKIFCFILSTRSGGIGVNLTGANAVIFYDSDWNPTMDAQAQDRCHRIGQTRDVHIYRLISEKTVEENILKKATQKRKLGELAIEEGGFTSEFFKKSNIRDIFELVDADVTKVKDSNFSQSDLEQVMARVEDERDVVAAKVAGAEAVAELAEFDESQMNADGDEADPDVLKVEQEMKQLMDELKPIERYAVKYLETLSEPDRLNEIRQTEEEIEQHKRRWEEKQQSALEEETKFRKEMGDEEFSLTFQADDSMSQMFCPDDLMETMPLWMPPTPPLSDNEFDAYVEPSMGFLYEREPMAESDLPPIYAEKEEILKSTKLDPVLTTAAVAPTVAAALTPPSASMSDVPPAVAETIASIRNSVVLKSASKELQPRSLFSANLTSKLKQTPRRTTTPPPGGMENEAAEVLQDWNVVEDFSLLNAVTKGQQMAYSLASGHEGHGVNWEYISEWVTLSCGRYRSPKQCHKRYESVILPREEGRPVFYDALNKKSRNKGMLPNQELTNPKKFRVRTGSQFQLEGQSYMINHTNQRFHHIRTTSANKARLCKQPGFSLHGVPISGRSTDKHASVLNSYGINYDSVVNPMKLVEIYEEKQRQKDIETKKQQHLQQQQFPRFKTMEQQQQQQTLVRTPAPPVVTTPFVTGSPQQNVSGQNQISFIVSGPSGRFVAGKPLQVQSQSAVVNQVVTVGSPQRGGASALTALIGRPPPVLPQGATTTATVYRQLTPQGYRVQRTPPGTPAPLNAFQTSTAYPLSNSMPRTVVTVPGTADTIGAVVVQAAPQQMIQPPSDYTALIKPPQGTTTTNLRFQTPQTGNRQRVQLAPQGTAQYGGGGSFLVSAEVSKSNVAGHPVATILQPTGGRYSGNPNLRTHMGFQLQSGSPHLKKNAAPHLTRLATLQPGARGALHLVPSSPTTRLTSTGVATVGSIRNQTNIGQQLLRGGTIMGQRIPSVNSILSSSVGRVDTVTVPTIIVQQQPQGVPLLQQQQQQQQQFPPSSQS